jgi:TolA-binding protein
MVIASIFMKQLKPDEAMIYLKDAFIHAPTPIERRKALRSIINVYVQLGKKKLAISAAKRYMHYYGDAEDACNVALQAARLSYELNNVDEALRLYDEIIGDAHVDFVIRFEAAKELIGIFVEDKNYSAAEKRLKTLLDSARTDTEKGECEFMSAKLLYYQKKYPEAAKAFALVADKRNELRADSLYWEMRSLLAIEEYEKALKCSESALREFEGNGAGRKCFYFHAYILEKLGHKDEARSEYLDFALKNPKSDYAPMSLFGAANIFLSEKEYVEAAKLFASLAETYPADSLAPNALYKKYYCEYFQGNENEAVSNAKKLIDIYPKSRFSASALFWLVDYFRELKDYKKALAFLDELLSKFHDDKNISAQALYEKAYVLSKAEDSNKAIDVLKELNQKYPDNKVASDGLFLCGDIYSARGDYAEAITYYQKAAERRPGSPLEAASLGRVGDCEFSLYTKTFNKEYLHKSLKEYEKVLEHKDLSPFVKNQCLYKMGKSYELLGFERMALIKYRELIYGYKIDKARGSEVSPIWTVKAGHSAISIYLKDGSPSAVNSAMEIYKVLIKLNIDLAEDYKKLLEKLKDKHNI